MILISGEIVIRRNTATAGYHNSYSQFMLGPGSLLTPPPPPPPTLPFWTWLFDSGGNRDLSFFSAHKMHCHDTWSHEIVFNSSAEC